MQLLERKSPKIKNDKPIVRFDLRVSTLQFLATYLDKLLHHSMVPNLMLPILRYIGVVRNIKDDFMAVRT